MAQSVTRKTTHALELLVVAVVVALLAAVAIPKFTSAALQSKESCLKRELRTIRSCIDLFKNDTGGYPLALTDLSATVAPAKCYNPVSSETIPVQTGSWRGPYISEIDLDPISNAAFKYAYSTGTVQSSAPSIASDGTNYGKW